METSKQAMIIRHCKLAAELFKPSQRLAHTATALLAGHAGAVRVLYQQLLCALMAGQQCDKVVCHAEPAQEEEAPPRKRSKKPRRRDLGDYESHGDEIEAAVSQSLLLQAPRMLQPMSGPKLA